MRLLVDVGNTRIKWGLAHDGKISDYGAKIHAGRPVMEVLTEAWGTLQTPERVVVANVAGAAFAQKLDRYCREHFKTAAEYVIPLPAACGVTNAYTQPAQLGADRWAALIGAFHIYGGPACVIGCGTAITVDTVSREGRHLGGLIAPGLGVMRTALAAAAVAIPDEAGEALTLYARDTRSAVSSGSLYAAAGLIDRVSTQIQAEQGADTRFILTGGDAEQLQSMLHRRFTLAHHLVLEGLALLAGQHT